MSQRRNWFHCSTRDYGPRWTAARKVPVNCGTGEPPTPRLCVAASVAQCFAARLFDGDVFVYRTETPRRSVKPVAVNDACITGERWLVPPVAMVLADVVPAGVVSRACGGTRRRVLDRYAVAELAGQSFRPLTAVDRLYCFREAIQALGDAFCSPADRRFVAKAIAYFESRETAA